MRSLLGNTINRRKADTRKTLAIIALAFAGVLSLSTVGYMVIEGWSLQQALFFTIITITTVGYGDYGLSQAGEQFTLLVMVGGIGVVTYSITTVFPAIFDLGRRQERRMYKQIMRLSDHVILCGLGRIGHEVCQQLAGAEVPFVIIDQDETAVRWATAEGFLAITGDATDDDVLEEVNIHNARAMACLASSDTANIVITLGARHLNPDLFIISRAEHEDAIRKLRRAGASRIISPIRTGGDCIAQTIMNPQLADFYEYGRAGHHGLGLIEIKVDSDSSLVGQTVGEVQEALTNVAIVGLRGHHGQMRIRPADEQVLEAGETVIAAGEPGHVAQLQELARAQPAAAAA